MITLRPYQTDAVTAIRGEYASGHRRVLLVSPTGSGKTVLFSHITHHAAAKKQRVWILAHRVELLDQISRTLGEFGTRHGFIAAGYPAHKDALVQVAGVFTVARRLPGERVAFHHRIAPPDLIIVDECFPAGTLIDGVPIESVAVGDTVRCVDHARGVVTSSPVARIFRREYAGAWYRIVTEDGDVVCTEEHPIFVAGMGYVTALDLAFFATRGKDDLRVVRHREGARANAGGPTPCHSSVLLCPVCGSWSRQEAAPADSVNAVSRVRGSGDVREAVGTVRGSASRMGAASRVSREVPLGTIEQEDDAHERSPTHASFGADEAAQPDGEPGNRREDGAVDAGQDVSGAWREWDRDAAAARDCICAQRPDGVRYLHDFSARSVREPANVLQGGRGDTRSDARHRGGREVAPPQAVEVSGRTEDGRVECARVVRVEVYERGSGQRPEWVPREDTVYNLEVADHHNYFANDILVHNCHHATNSTTWGHIINAFPKARVLGVTATPCRLDGTGLGECFDAMVLGPSVAELTAQGALVPLKAYAPASIATEGLHTRAGEFIASELAVRADNATVTGDAVAHYNRLAAGKAAVAFCVSVEHARHVAESFTAAGIPAQSVDGTMDRTVRRSIIAAFVAGKLRVLTSCDLVSEGFDVPRVEVGISLRPTQSTGLWLQQVGRILRPSPGKSHAVLLDHAGNIARHGLPEDEREWSLDGLAPKTRASNEVADVAMRVCPKCYAAVRGRPVACPECGAVFPVAARTVDVTDGVLAEVTRETRRPMSPEVLQRKREQGTASDYEALVALGTKRGMKNPSGWAKHVMEARAAKVARERVAV